MATKTILYQEKEIPRWGRAYILPSEFCLEGDEFSATIFSTEYTSSFVFSRKWSGVSKSGVPWKRWQPFARYMISVKPHRISGKQSLNIYSRKLNNGYKWSPFMNVTGMPDYLSDPMLSAYIEEFNNEVYRLGSTIAEIPKPPVMEFRNPTPLYDYALKCAYPMLAVRQKTSDYNDNRLIMGARLSTNIEYTIALFGKRNYRKDLVKAVAETFYPSNLAVAREFRNLVPVDWIVKFLRGMADCSAPKLPLKDMRSFLTERSMIERRRLLNDFMKSYAQAGPREKYLFPMNVQDGIRSYNLLPEDVHQRMNFRSWKHLHDASEMELDKMRYQARDIPVIPMAEIIAAQQPVDGISVYLPKDTDEVREWGREMSHCIGTYADDAVKGDVVLLGVRENGVLVGNVQIQVASRRMAQILGKHNRFLPDNVQVAVAKIMDNAEVLEPNWKESVFGFTYRELATA